MPKRAAKEAGVSTDSTKAKKKTIADSETKKKKAADVKKKEEAVATTPAKEEKKTTTKNEQEKKSTETKTFKEIVTIKKGESIPERFAAISDYLLNHSILLCGHKAYRLVEIEFYMVADFHDDCYAHKTPEQKQNLIWYFHRTVPGIDLAFGGGDVQFGGILLRSVEDLSDGALIEGTGNILGLACRNNGKSSKETLMPLLAPDLAAVDDELKLEDFVPTETQSSGTRKLPPKVKVQLTLIHDRGNTLANKPIYSSPRVSLGVKNTPGQEKYHRLMAHYRFLTELRQIKAGKPNMVLGLRAQLGWTAEAIADATGCKLATVEKYVSLLSTPTKRSMDEFAPCRGMLLEDYCTLYQIIHRK